MSDAPLQFDVDRGCGSAVSGPQEDGVRKPKGILESTASGACS